MSDQPCRESPPPLPSDISSPYFQGNIWSKRLVLDLASKNQGFSYFSLHPMVNKLEVKQILIALLRLIFLKRKKKKFQIAVGSLGFIGIGN